MHPQKRAGSIGSGPFFSRYHPHDVNSSQGDYLKIAAKRESHEEEKKKTFYRSELSYGRLVRTTYLPAKINAEKVKAELKNGILEIKLPKAREIKRHTVKVV